MIRSKESAAFTLVEVLISVALIGVVFTSFYAALSAGLVAVGEARENLRATQLLTEKMEEFRTFSWAELNGGNIPATFTAYFYPTNASNPTEGGVIYTGVVTIASSGISESYSNDLRKVIVNLTWVSGNIQRQRTMQTLASQNGMRNYVY
ncbi:MAG: type II secretion system protein [Verrucomicrobia bacterium]|nr:type II secretion system protein [Verrucomicrobiota bacterium]